MTALSQAKLDANWFQKALQFFVEPYQYIKIDPQILEQEKQEFLQDEKRNPDFFGKYQIDKSDIAMRMQNLLTLYEEVDSFTSQSD